MPIKKERGFRVVWEISLSSYELSVFSLNVDNNWNGKEEEGMEKKEKNEEEEENLILI